MGLGGFPALRRIGIVASGATELSATVILSEGEEKKVKAEDLVLIDNKGGNKVLAVCRGGEACNENLKTGSFSPGVAYAKIGRYPSNAKEFYAFGLTIIGDVTQGLQQNKTVIAPSSDVYVFEDEDDPMSYLGQGPYTIGHYKEHPSWKVPINERYIPYHIGVFGITGAGKSFLARYQIVPLLRKTGYDVLIFDWKGSDYAPYYPHVLEFSEIGLDDDTIVNYLTSKLDYFGYYSGDYKYRNPIKDALETVIYEGEWRNVPLNGLKEHLTREVLEVIRSDSLTKDGEISSYGRSMIRRFLKHMQRLDVKSLKNIRGELTPSKILEAAKNRGILVLDVSLSGKDEKLSVFLSIANYLKELMERREKLNLALLIDEGPQYCPFMPRGLEAETTEVISQLCALGRSYNLSITLLSQGIAGEIGINAAIRRNLNTQFIGKIHPLDMDEAGKLLGQLDIDPRFLVTMPDGYFYFLGKMNPSPIPLLISFEIDESKAPTETVGG
jgi:DNA helicase HerA-like ATPase